MATVRQTLALQDKVSPVLSKIVNAMYTTIDTMERLDKASGKGIGASHFARMRTQVDSANTAVWDLKNNVQQLGTPIEKARKGFSGWQAAIVTAHSGIQLVQTAIAGVNKLTGFFDNLMGVSARLNLVTEDQAGLQNKIFEAAQRSRGEYTAMASTVAKLNLLAADAFEPFGGEDASVKFAETLNKAFVISGASTEERNSAMYQMSQALASGKLQGDEYRSIIENAPLVAKSIEKYMREVKGLEGTMKDWSSEGLLTSDVIITAVQNAAEEIDTQFEDMPMKFGDHMAKLRNQAIMSLAPITERFNNLMDSDKFVSMIEKVSYWIQVGVAWLDRMFDKLEEIGNNPGFQQFATTAGTALAIIVGLLGWVIQTVLTIVNLVMSAWPVLEPVLLGVAAALLIVKSELIAQAALWLWNTVVVGGYNAVMTFLRIGYGVLTGSTAAASAAQFVYNSALLACPLTWIIMLIIAVVVAIYAVIAIINKVTGSTISATGIILGALAVAGAFVWDLFLGILDLILGVINYLVNPIIAFVNFFGNVFNDPIGAVIHLFGDLADNVLGVLESIARAMDKVFGSSMADTVAGWRNSLESKIEIAAKQYGNGAYEEVMGNLNLSSESLGLKRIEYSDAWAAGYSAGESVDESVGSITDKLFGGTGVFDDPTGAGSGTDLSDYATGGNINADVSGSEVSLSDEDLKYLRDIAKLEYVNQYTTLRPTVQATFGDIRETADVNQVIEVLENAIEAAYSSSMGRG